MKIFVQKLELILENLIKKEENWFEVTLINFIEYKFIIEDYRT